MKKTKFFIAMFVMCTAMTMMSCGNTTEAKDAAADTAVVDSDSVADSTLVVDSTVVDSVK